MAEQPQLLLEFTENIRSDLSRGAITPQEAVVACQQYAFLRDALSSQAVKLSQATIEGDDELTEALQQVFADTTEHLRSLPGFQAQAPDEQKTKKEIHDIGFLRRHAFLRVRTHTRGTSVRYERQRREFIHALVAKYSAFVPGAQTDEVEKAFDRAMITSEKDAGTSRSLSFYANRISEELQKNAGLNIPQGQDEKLTKAVMDVFSERAPDISDMSSSIAMEQRFTQELYTHADIQRPDVVADVFIHAPDGQKEDAIVHGIKLAGVAESLEAYTNQPIQSGAFFTQEHAKGAVKGLQQAADGILSIAGEPVREIVYKNKIEGVLRSLRADTQSFTDRLGKSFVQSAVFSNAYTQLSRSVGQKQQRSSVGSVVGDVFTSVFRGPLNDATTERVYNYFELLRADAHAPKGYGFFPSGAPPWTVFSPGLSALRASPEKPGRPVGADLPRARIPSALPIGILGSVGYWASRAITLGIDNATSFVFTNPSLPMEIRRSRQASTMRVPFTQDLPLVISITVVATIIILFIFPSPFNLAQIDSSSKFAVILESLIKEPEDDEPSTNNSGWPVKCGCIINGPFQDTHETNHLNALDFVFGTCSPSTHVAIYSVEDGTVETVSKQYVDNEVQNSGKSSYGNYVIISGKHRLLYAHLSAISVSRGDKVTKDQKIGTSDNNGYSLGEHLHFELLDGGAQPLDKPNDVLPQPGTNGLCVKGDAG